MNRAVQSQPLIRVIAKILLSCLCVAYCDLTRDERSRVELFHCFISIESSSSCMRTEESEA